jgi:hypothetical protein
MSVLVRTDPHATCGDVKIAHPDWIAVDVDGMSSSLVFSRDVGHLLLWSLQF